MQIFIPFGLLIQRRTPFSRLHFLCLIKINFPAFFPFEMHTHLRLGGKQTSIQILPYPENGALSLLFLRLLSSSSFLRRRVRGKSPRALQADHVELLEAGAQP